MPRHVISMSMNCKVFQINVAARIVKYPQSSGSRHGAPGGTLEDVLECKVSQTSDTSIMLAERFCCLETALSQHASSRWRPLLQRRLTPELPQCSGTVDRRATACCTEQQTVSMGKRRSKRKDGASAGNKPGLSDLPGDVIEQIVAGFDTRER